MRNITYCEALNEAMSLEMERDPNVFVYGIGVSDHMGVFGSTTGLDKKFGKERCLDTPLSEDAMTGFGLGAAINGMRPIHVHIRVDFLLLAMNQLANMVSSFRYFSGGEVNVPIVIRAIIGRGWGQGHQHSKSMYSIFAHIPGMKVVLPTTPKDAKGLLTAAIRDENPVLVLEHRWLYWQSGEVPEAQYTIPIGEENKLREGRDITIVAISWMNVEAIKAADILSHRGISVEVIDPRAIAPLDDSLIIESVNKTGHCIIADNDWIDYGCSAEIATRIYSKCFGRLRSPVERIGFAFTPCPTVRHLEDQFYPNAVHIIRAIEQKLDIEPMDLAGEEFYSHENKFRGPF